MSDQEVDQAKLERKAKKKAEKQARKEAKRREQAELPQEAPEPTTQEAVPAASNEAQEEREQGEKVVLQHLQILADHSPVTVSQFAELAVIASSDAKRLLSQYVTQGLVVRKWQLAKGRYSLTDAGQATLTSLRNKFPVA